MKKKPSKLKFTESVSAEYAAERKREESARIRQEDALKPHRAVQDAFGICNDVWKAVEDCHAGAKFDWGDSPCRPIPLLAGQLDQMLAATVSLCVKDNVRLAFKQFSVDGFQGHDLDAARTVKILLERCN